MYVVSKEKEEEVGIIYSIYGMPLQSNLKAKV